VSGIGPRAGRLVRVVWLGAWALGASAWAQAPSEPAQQAADWDAGRAVSASAEANYWGAAGERQQEKTWLRVPRALLFLPRMVLRYVLLQPVEKLAFFVGRLQGSTRFQVFLLTLYRTGFRPSAGLRLMFDFGPEYRASSTITLSYGGGNFQFHEAALRYRFSDTARLKASFRYGRQGDKRFYGIGNEQPEENQTRYFFEDLQTGLNLKKAWTPTLGTELEVDWRRIRTDDSTDLEEGEATLSDLFGPQEVPGFAVAQNFLRTRLAATIDLRTDREEHKPGVLIESYADAYWTLGGQSLSTLLSGAEVAGIVPLFRDRTLAARLLAAGASKLGDEIPFYLLPAIGKSGVLRGYPSGRLRDRFMTVATLEYRWPVWTAADAVLFIDAGRVFPDLDSFTFSGWRWGSGVGLRFNTKRGVLFSLQLAFSSETTEAIALTDEDLF
jgi:hypothetical protein